MLVSLLGDNFWLFKANLITTDTPQAEKAEETTEETPADIVPQSVPDENPGDEIVQGLDVLAEVKLPSTIHKSA